MSSASASAASDVSKSPLDYVLSNMVFKNVNCTEYGKQKGGAPDISIDEITVLVILFHGTIRITKIPDGGYTGVPIDVSKLSSIDNLAYLSLAPTGLSNIGTNHELDAYRTYIEYEIKKKIEESIEESIVESLQKIETKADELVTKNASQPVSQPVKRKRSSGDGNNDIFSRICKYCFSLPEKLLSPIQALGNLLTNYNFTNTFTVCKSVGPASLSGGNGLNYLKGGTPNPQLSMSHDMFVLMLNELRLKIKKFDSERVTNLCTTQLQQLNSTTTSQPPDYRKTLETTLENIEERCRHLHVLKGLGLNESQPTGFVNKHLLYNIDFQ